MKILMFALLCFTIGCQTAPQLVTARFKPKRVGLLSIPDTSNPYINQKNKNTGADIMRSFCAPLNVDVVEISKDSQVTGATTQATFGILTTTNSTKDSTLIHFECTGEKENLFFSATPDALTQEDPTQARPASVKPLIGD